MSAKYIFVTGGVVSSLGKGLAAASIGCLLESRGLKVNLMKFDPYLNVDPGTMSPFQPVSYTHLQQSLRQTLLRALRQRARRRDKDGHADTTDHHHQEKGRPWRPSRRGVEGGLRRLRYGHDGPLYRAVDDECQ